MKSKDKRENDVVWRQLEKLSMLYISDSINNKALEYKELTREIKDGGYDGKLVINITEDGSISHTIMMEAKFRSTIKSLPLQDCSKALIIAFNRAVQTLYIVTNVIFSKQANEEIEKFKNKINLQVKKIEGPQLKDYAKKKGLKSSDGFSDEFIEYLDSSIPEKADFTLKLEHFDRKQLSRPNILEKKKSEKIYKSDRFITSLKLVENSMKEVSGPYIIQGPAGSGKTVFLNTLQLEMDNSPHLFIIDLQQCTSSRILFIKIIECLWGNELSVLFSDCSAAETKKELEKLIEQLSDGKLNNKISGAVIKAICMDQEALNGHSDTYNYYLTEFIYKLLYPYKGQNKFAFAFYNLNKSEIDSLNFLYAIISKIHTLITIIIEFRMPFFLENNEKKLVASENYYNKFIKISSNINFINIEPIKTEEISLFLDMLGYKLTPKQQELLVQSLGNSPLYLSLGLSFIKSQVKMRNLAINELSNNEFKQIINLFSGQGNSIIFTIIQYYKQDIIIANCFEAAILLDGSISLNILEYICGEKYDIYAEKLIESSLFILNWGSLVVRHNLIYDSINKLSSPIRKSLVANKILKGYAEHRYTFENEKIKLFELNYFAGNQKYILDEIESLSRFLKKEHEYYLIIKFNNLVCEVIAKNGLSSNKEYMLSKVLITTLYAYTQLHIFQIEDVEKKLVKLETICNLNKYDPNYTIITLWYYWIKWYIEFYTGEIRQSYDTIIKAKEKVDIKDYGSQIGEQIYWSYGLSHKRLTSLKQGIDDFKQGIKKYPNSVLLKNAVILHKAHQKLRKNPAYTCKICSKLVSIIEKTDLFYNEIIQARVDIAISAFYAGKYEYAFTEAQKDYEISISNDISYQEGRSMNIIGACQLVNGNAKDAYISFRKAYRIFEESGNYLFMWRPYFNIGQIYNQSGQKEKMVNYYLKFIEKEIPNVLERLPDLTIENSEMVCLIYIARILKKHNRIIESEQVYNKYKNACFKKYYYETEENFQRIINDLNYFHKGYLIILG